MWKVIVLKGTGTRTSYNNNDNYDDSVFISKHNLSGRASG